MMRFMEIRFPILTNSLLEDIINSTSPWALLAERFSEFAIRDWLLLKQDLVFNYIQRLRDALDSHGHQDKQLVPHAFPPPFNIMSGLDFGTDSASGGSYSRKTIHNALGNDRAFLFRPAQ